MSRLGILFSRPGSNGNVSFECLVLRSWIKILILEKVMRESGYVGDLPDMPFFILRGCRGYGLVVSDEIKPASVDEVTYYGDGDTVIRTGVGENVYVPEMLGKISDFLSEIAEEALCFFGARDVGLIDTVESFAEDRFARGCAGLLDEAYFEDLIEGDSVEKACQGLISDLTDCSACFFSDSEYAKASLECLEDILSEVAGKCETVSELCVSVRALRFAGHKHSENSYGFGRYGYDFSVLIPVKKPDGLDLSGGLGEYDISSLSYTSDGIRLFCSFDFEGDLGGEDYGFAGVLNEDILDQGISVFTEVFAVCALAKGG